VELGLGLVCARDGGCEPAEDFWNVGIPCYLLFFRLR